jgi:betaine-aldehyde dehydrogenase
MFDTSKYPPVLKTDGLPLDCIYVDGKWLRSESSEVIEVVSPVTESVIASVANANKSDVVKAVEAASVAFEYGEWPKLTFGERAKWLRKLAAELEKRVPDLALAWTMQVGLSYKHAKSSMPYVPKALNGYADLATNFTIEQEQLVPSGVGYRRYEPVGVVAAIGPWNAPLMTMLNKIAPALLAGCTVIMKPAPETPIDAYILAQCANEINLPPGVLNLLCSDREGSESLVRHEGVNKVSFTGSVETGQRIAGICGQRVARCTLELGGKSAAIILADYDFTAAADSLANGISFLSGQNCASLTRILVPREKHDDFVSLIKKRCEEIIIGNAFDESAQLCSLISRRHLARVEACVSKGVEEGATLVTGGERPQGMSPGYYYRPTVFANVSNAMSIAQEEIFGPVVCVIPYNDIDDAITIANASSFGLSGAVFTNDSEKALDIARRIRTGNVAQNGQKTNFSIGFGGFKRSGLGREGGMQGLMSYLESKTILLEKTP